MVRRMIRVHRLERCIIEVVRRHFVLRTPHDLVALANLNPVLELKVHRTPMLLTHDIVHDVAVIVELNLNIGPVRKLSIPTRQHVPAGVVRLRSKGSLANAYETATFVNASGGWWVI